MARNEGSTMTVPIMYQGARLPIRVLNLSLNAPTIGVVRPSAN